MPITLCRLQLVQQLKDTNKSDHHKFYIDMLKKLEDGGHDDQLVFSDEATFHVGGIVNEHNTRIRATEASHVTQACARFA